MASPPISPNLNEQDDFGALTITQMMQMCRECVELRWRVSAEVKAREEAQRTKDEVERKCAALQSHKVMLQSRIGTQELQLRQSREERTGLEKRLGSQEMLLKQLRQEKTELNTRLESLGRRLSLGISELEKQKIAMQGQLDNAAELQDTIVASYKQVETLQKNNRGLRTLLDKEKAHREARETHFEERHGQAEAEREELRRQVGQLTSSLRLERAMTRAAYMELQDELGLAEMRQYRRALELDCMRTRFSRGQAALVRSAERNAAAERCKEDLRSHVTRLRKELSLEKATCYQKNTSIGVLTKTKQKLGDELKDCKRALQWARDDVAKIEGRCQQLKDELVAAKQHQESVYAQRLEEQHMLRRNAPISPESEDRVGAALEDARSKKKRPSNGLRPLTGKRRPQKPLESRAVTSLGRILLIKTEPTT
jgi:chromosome segregation ATPase